MTPENLREKLENLLKERDYFNPDFNREEHCEELANEIMSLISQHSENKGEHLIVNKISTRHLKGDLTIKTTYAVSFLSNDMSEDDLNNFCNRFNLKIKGESND